MELQEVSILVFLDSLLQPFWHKTSLRTSYSFQSLFFWIHFYNVFVCGYEHRGRGFQSLFFWIHFYNLDEFERKSAAIDVSILVFLDSLLQLLFRHHKFFLGLRFQSLFFWIHFYNLSLWIMGAEMFKFQSLFFWIHFYNECESEDEALEILFQSLFFWIHFYNTRYPTRKARCIPRFNPCFSGFTSTTEVIMSDPRPVNLFQSLFFWIHFYNLRCGAVRTAASQFQSLFFWIHFYNSIGPCGVVGVGSYRFNPCFSGFTSTT